MLKSSPENIRLLRCMMLIFWMGVMLMIGEVNAEKMVFPNIDWEEATPESQNVNSTKLKEAVTWLDNNSGIDGIKELIIIRNGYMIWKGPDIDAYHKIFSCTKVFTSTVFGLLIDDGKCSLDDPAVRYLTTLDDQYPLYSKIKLRHLVSMSGGYQGIVRDVSEEEPWGDPMGYLIPVSPRYEAGTACAYHDHDVFLLGSILTRLAKQPIKDVFNHRIADVIGMTRWDWGICGTLDNGVALNNAAGTPAKNPGIQTTARELARLGHLYLNRGNWNGKQLLSASFVDHATTNQVPVSLPNPTGADPGGHYGFYWWTNGVMRNGKQIWQSAPPKTYTARGALENYCFVVPEWNIVIVRLGSANSPNDLRVSDQIWNTFFTKLGSAINGIRQETSEPIGIANFDAKISFYTPNDGGTPRSSERINRLSLNKFLMKASIEDGQNPLTHAVSRLDLVCCNNGKQAETVTLNLDLSGDGVRTNFDDNMYGDMPSRNFVYIQSPGQAWKQINGKTDGWICTVSFAIEPGETKIGLSPWYNYEDYLHFINSLPEHPHLKKEIIGSSDKGREHWELIITDPDVPIKNKRCIFIHAREHAYEAFSSYSIEGLLDYLLSDSAKDDRSHFVFVIHPMTNVDGVADGYEYRMGYDYPDPRGTASARLTFDTIDKLKPDYIVTWHNWVAPRNIDTLFYTDSQDGKATRRAWDLFTQRFPSPRAFDHRWENDDEPIKRNWVGRSLSDDNVHQYAMKHYGSQVWGWEMPWWNRDTDDARKAGFDFAKAFLATLNDLNTNQHIDNPDIVINDIPKWDMHEFELHGKSWVDNPFIQSAIIGEFISPSGKKLMVEGFYDGDDIWRVRFA
ncbi:MAG: hypothetical protein QG588_1752, partial [Candidatus Poribacteria bacterium]|nr:hypothetical protein [Candidatus Poribacteria bacterium]